MLYDRPDIRKHFDGDKFTRANAEEWLKDIGYSTSASDSSLDKLFANNKVYDSSTIFIRDVEKLVPSNNNAGDNALNKAELDSVFGSKSNTVQIKQNFGNNTNNVSHTTSNNVTIENNTNSSTGKNTSHSLDFDSLDLELLNTSYLGLGSSLLNPYSSLYSPYSSLYSPYSSLYSPYSSLYSSSYSSLYSPYSSLYSSPYSSWW
jgi:hypothetical protein